MRRVLLITYYFPPAGGSGTHRPAALARHLRQYGWRPTILTAGMQWHSGSAHESAALAGPDPDVRRTPPDGTPRLSRRLKRALPTNPTAFARILDPNGLWARSALRVGRRILAAEHFDAILTTSPPYSLALAGAALARRTGVPWVMDLRSPWALALSTPWIGGAGYLVDRAIQGRLCEAASAVTWHDRGAWDSALRLWPMLRHRVMEWIPNGYDPDAMHGGAGRNDGRFTIAHVGVFYWNSERERARSAVRTRVARLLAYSPDDVDLSAQSVGFLLRAVRLLLDRRPELAGRLRIDLVGQLHPSDAGLPEQLGLSGIVELRGSVPHAEAVERVRRADALYLPFWWSRRVGRVIRAPSKLFEYIGARKPILGVVGAGDTRDVLETAGTGLLCAEPSEDELAENILTLYNQRAAHELHPNEDYIRGFEWPALVGRMAEVLDRATREAR